MVLVKVVPGFATATVANSKIVITFIFSENKNSFLPFSYLDFGFLSAYNPQIECKIAKRGFYIDFKEMNMFTDE